MIKNNRRKGLTIVEVLVGSAIFAMIAVSVYEGYTQMLRGMNVLKVKSAAVDLANEQFEIIRNMAYSNVGIPGGIPVGVVPHLQNLTRNGVSFLVTTTVRNIDEAFDGTLGGSPNDSSPADNKLVEVEVDCVNCQSFTPIVYSTKISPKNLETASINGALFIKVFDANGQPVSGADVHIENKKVTPNIIIDDTTNASGMLQIVDTPPGNDAYEITVSKAGYSTDKTYTPGAVANPNPAKPHATIVLQQVTQISLTIDKLSDLNISTINSSCAGVGNVDFNIKGSKLIGSSPDIYKYENDLETNASGIKNLTNMEWDNYSINLTDSGYDLIGMNPLSPVQLNPDSNQNMSIILASKSPNRLLITVKDNATYLPLTDADVHLEAVSSGYDNTKITGRGFLTQTDWSGGSGQTDYSNENMYLSSDGNIDNSSITGEIKLNTLLGIYSTSGELISSTFDTGSASNFHEILWQPTSNSPEAGIDPVKFQIAVNNDPATSTWNYIGPDGTESSYYTLTNKNISSDSDGNRYFRYKLFLHTDSATTSPVVSDISVTFTSACTPAGQVSFAGLASGDYNLTVSKAGYQDYNQVVTVNSSWKEEQVLLAP
ncbi:MAG: prepilin-type N-terminal cleavage/methylation domain-containing protein [bacterium]|nr:prepilin-type N-terminal cleavage/methylation domain-containing protein [bacterium]